MRQEKSRFPGKRYHVYLFPPSHCQSSEIWKYPGPRHSIPLLPRSMNDILKRREEEEEEEEEKATLTLKKSIRLYPVPSNHTSTLLLGSRHDPLTASVYEWSC